MNSILRPTPKLCMKKISNDFKRKIEDNIIHKESSLLRESCNQLEMSSAPNYENGRFEKSFINI